jgi:hypothetical protein
MDIGYMKDYVFPRIPKGNLNILDFQFQLLHQTFRCIFKF